MRLIYLLLRHVEAKQTNGPAPLPETLGNNGEYTWGEIQYHARLCQEAGYLILANDDDTAEGVLRLTWGGHEAMDGLAKTFDKRRGI